MKGFKRFLLPVIVVGYSFLYIATSYQVPCEDDCARVSGFSSDLTRNRDYVYSAFRCSRVAVSDTICVQVKDTTGINWNLLADTACTLASQQGLFRQKLIFIRYTNVVDTILVKQCP